MSKSLLGLNLHLIVISWVDGVKHVLEDSCLSPILPLSFL